MAFLYINQFEVTSEGWPVMRTGGYKEPKNLLIMVHTFWSSSSTGSEYVMTSPTYVETILRSQGHSNNILSEAVKRKM